MAKEIYFNEDSSKYFNLIHVLTKICFNPKNATIIADDIYNFYISHIESSNKEFTLDAPELGWDGTIKIETVKSVYEDMHITTSEIVASYCYTGEELYTADNTLEGFTKLLIFLIAGKEY